MNKISRKLIATCLLDKIYFITHILQFFIQILYNVCVCVCVCVCNTYPCYAHNFHVEKRTASLSSHYISYRLFVFSAINLDEFITYIYIIVFILYFY